MNLGEKIKHYREGLRWTLEHLSDLSGVEKGTISALEVRKSKRSEFAGKIAAAFGLSVNQLLGDQDFLRELKAGKRPIELESNRDIAAPVRAYAGNRIWVIGNGQGGLPDRIWTDGDHPVGASDKYAEVVPQTKDRYGRTVARVRCDGQDVSESQVLGGMAWVFDRYVTDRGLYRLQDEAKAARRGLWGDSTPVPPWEWRKKLFTRASQ